MIRAVAFDLDGTLVRGTTTCRHLAAKLGHTEEMDRLERDFAAGTISNAIIADQIGRYCAGKRKAEIHALLESVPVIAGINETVGTLKQRGILEGLRTAQYYIK